MFWCSQADSCRNPSPKVCVWLIEKIFFNLGSKVYGEYRTGKTQLAHTMCVVSQLPQELGGAAGKARLLHYFFVESKSYRLHTLIPKVGLTS